MKLGWKKEGKDDKMSKGTEQVSRVLTEDQIKIILIETFEGVKYVFRLDREYEKALMNLLKKLFKSPLGSIAHISLRTIKKDEYDKIKPSAGFMEQKNNTTIPTNC